MRYCRVDESLKPGWCNYANYTILCNSLCPGGCSGGSAHGFEEYDQGGQSKLKSEIDALAGWPAVSCHYHNYARSVHVIKVNFR